MKFYLAQNCLEPLNVCHVDENKRLSFLVTPRILDALRNMEKGDRVSTERRVGGLAHRDLSMEQATFYCDSSFRSDGIATPFAKKIPESCHRRSRSERDGRPWPLFGSCWASCRWPANSSNLIEGHSKLASANPIFGPARVDPRATIRPERPNFWHFFHHRHKRTCRYKMGDAAAIRNQ